MQFDRSNVYNNCSDVRCISLATVPLFLSPMALSLLAAELNIFVACVLYGVYLVTLGIAAGVLLRTKSGRPGSRIVVGMVSVILFVNSTIDLGVGMNMVVRAFVSYEGPGGARTYFHGYLELASLHQGLEIRPSILYCSNILIEFNPSQIYRCWYMWSKSWPIIGLPVLLWLGSFSCQMAMLILLHTLGERPVNSGNLLPWGLAFWILTIFTNILTTSLIVSRILRVEKQAREFRSTRDGSPPESALNKAMRHIIESGMIYVL
ncbi:hypothetical protein C8R47DRAFT_1244623, partial [Mycena vitilis]